MRTALAIMIACCGLAAPANAHWQFTKWGMTPEQVIAASNGTVKQGDGAVSAQGGDTEDASGTYSVNGASFDASFFFENAKLKTVTLSSRDGKLCAQTMHDLQAVYGTPFESSPGSSVSNATWMDRTKNNRVKMILVDLGYCELQYSALVSASGSGL